jgi:hypothetical protein
MSRRSNRVVVITLVLGCYAPPKQEIADDTANPSTEAAHLPHVEAAKQRLAAGDGEGAIAELMQAAEIVGEEQQRGSVDYCSFGTTMVILAKQMLAAEHNSEAVAAHAIALRFAQECEQLDREDLIAGRDAAQMAALGEREQLSSP